MAVEGFSGNYLGRDITIPAEQCYAVSIMKSYQRQGQELAERYGQLYPKYKDFETFMERGLRDGRAMLERCLQQTVDQLVREGYYDVNRENLLNRYGGRIFKPWAELQETLDAVCEESGRQVEADRAYRQRRKASRGRFVGGGFGLKGALEGMAAAGTLNALSGLAHSGANAVGNAMTRAAARGKLNTLYQEKLLPMVQDALAECTENMGMAILACHGCLKPEYLYGSTEEGRARARALRENYKKIPADQRPERAVEMLTLDPLQLDSYRLLLRDYKDPDGTLRGLAAALSMEAEYDALVSETAAETVKAGIDALAGQLQDLGAKADLHGSELEALQAQAEREVSAVFAQYGIPEDAYSGARQTYLEQIGQIISKGTEAIIDSRLSGVLKQAEKNIQALAAADLDAPAIQRITKEAWRQGTEIFDRLGIRESHEEALDRFFDQVDKAAQAAAAQVREKDLAERTFQGTLYETPALARQARSTWQAAVTACAPADSAGSSGELDEILAALNDLEAQAPDALREAIHKLYAGVSEKRDRVERNERTFQGVLFPTREEKETAEQDYHSLTQQFASETPVYTPSGNHPHTRRELQRAVDACRQGTHHPAAEKLALDYLEPILKKYQFIEQRDRRFGAAALLAYLYAAAIAGILLTQPIAGLTQFGGGWTLVEMLKALTPGTLGTLAWVWNLCTIAALLLIMLNLIKSAWSNWSSRKNGREALFLGPLLVSAALFGLFVITWIPQMMGMAYYYRDGYWLIAGLGVVFQVINVVITPKVPQAGGTAS